MIGPRMTSGRACYSIPCRNYGSFLTPPFGRDRAGRKEVGADIDPKRGLFRGLFHCASDGTDRAFTGGVSSPRLPVLRPIFK